MNQPGKATKPARGQLNRENEVPLLRKYFRGKYIKYVLLFAMFTFYIGICTFMDV